MFVGPDHLDVRARQDRGLAAGTEEADQIPEIAAKTFFCIMMYFDLTFVIYMIFLSLSSMTYFIYMWMFISGDRRRAQTESFCNVGATSTGFIRLVVNKQYFSGHDVSFTTLLQKYTLLKITTGRGET
jgi:hypothetical protein